MKNFHIDTFTLISEVNNLKVDLKYTQSLPNTIFKTCIDT